MASLDQLDKDLLKTSALGDGDILAENDLIYVDTMIQNPIVGWSTRTFEELRSRDMWAAGGADRYADQIESIEQTERDRIRSRMISDIEHRAADAYRSYQARTGQRTRPRGVIPTAKAKFVPVGRL